MLLPKRVKFRKQHRGRRKGMATRGNQIDFGEFGLVALEPAWITSRQIEAARIAMTRHIRRGGKVWIRIFPDKPFTKKPLETRMGKGKGPVEGWVAVVKPGRVMFEMNGVSTEVAKEAMRLAMHKLPIKCKFVVKEGAEARYEAAAEQRAEQEAIWREEEATAAAEQQAVESDGEEAPVQEQAGGDAPAEDQNEQ